MDVCFYDLLSGWADVRGEGETLWYSMHFPVTPKWSIRTYTEKKMLGALERTIKLMCIILLEDDKRQLVVLSHYQKPDHQQHKPFHLLTNWEILFPQPTEYTNRQRHFKLEAGDTEAPSHSSISRQGSQTSCYHNTAIGSQEIHRAQRLHDQTWLILLGELPVN